MSNPPAIPTEFLKMSGSGNDFIVFDLRAAAPAFNLEDAKVISAICARGTGVGADGVLVIESSDRARFRMKYFNKDGSRAGLCGNAALCATRLAADSAGAGSAEVRFETDSGEVVGRLRGDEVEVEFAPVSEIHREAPIPAAAGERCIGFALAGVPHLVVLCQEVSAVEVADRGRALRHNVWQPEGANVNFVSEAGAGSWAVRTFERGVEAETLACGTGAVATAILLHEWGLSRGETTVVTRSSSRLTVSLQPVPRGYRPILRGQARKVFLGKLLEP